MLLNQPLMTFNSMQFRLGYDLLPVLDSSAPPNKDLAILVAWSTMSAETAQRLAFAQYAKWFCEDMADHIELSVTLYVPENAVDTRAVFDDLDVAYETVSALVDSDFSAVAELASSLDCDLVLSPAPDALRDEYSDEVGLVSADVAAALHAIEIHLKGFDMPWSFEAPAKNMPWSNFYEISERYPFETLLVEHRASRAAGEVVHEVMRSLAADAIPALCFSRDRLEFYRQQDRWAQRHGLEHQDFGVEYAAHLNHFYMTFYAAVDQAAALAIARFNLEVPDDERGATYKAFRKARKPYAQLDAVFSDKAFWRMYKLPRLIRHRSAHSGPVKPQDVYFSDGEFTTEQLDNAAAENGLLDTVSFWEKREAPTSLIDNARWIAREKARRILMGPPRRHGVFLRDGKKKGLFYYPDPANDLNRLLSFLERVIDAAKPWAGTKHLLT